MDRCTGLSGPVRIETGMVRAQGVGLVGRRQFLLCGDQQPLVLVAYGYAIVQPVNWWAMWL